MVIKKLLKCESRTSLHAVQYKWQPGCSDVRLMASLDTLFLCSVGQQACLCS